jgi:outer membrane protein assembly factor BamD (BamD/ComL family)
MKIALLAVLLLIFSMSRTCSADNATELFYKGGDALKQQNYDLAIDYFMLPNRITSTRLEITPRPSKLIRHLLKHIPKEP